jgi:D-serine deaminase-like pyridoxal phosphate-dependent protein
VSSLRQAERFFAAGINDILCAVAIEPGKFAQALQRTLRVTSVAAADRASAPLPRRSTLAAGQSPPLTPPAQACRLRSTTRLRPSRLAS